MRWARRTQVKIGLTVATPLLVRLRVRHVDGTRNAADPATNDLAVPHQLDLGRVSLMDSTEFGFLEVSVHPERIGIDE